MCTQFEEITVSLTDNGIRTIRLNNPRRKNAIKIQTMKNLISALAEAEADDNTKIVAITGEKYEVLR